MKSATECRKLRHMMGIAYTLRDLFNDVPRIDHQVVLSASALYESRNQLVMVGLRYDASSVPSIVRTRAEASRLRWIELASHDEIRPYFPLLHSGLLLPNQYQVLVDVDVPHVLYFNVNHDDCVLITENWDYEQYRASLLTPFRTYARTVWGSRTLYPSVRFQ